MSTIRLLIADDQELIAESLKIVLELEGDMQVVGIAHNGEQAVQLCDELLPDLVLMDIHMPVLDGVEATRQIKQAHPHTKIIILTSFKEVNYVITALSLGAEGYLLKAIPPQQLAAGIRVVHTGGTLISPDMATAMIQNLTASRTSTTSSSANDTSSSPYREDAEAAHLPFSASTISPTGTNREDKPPLQHINERELALRDYNISEREMDVLLLLARGLRNIDIAEQLYLSEGTVKNYVSSLYGKLQVKGRREASHKAKNEGWLDRS
ncbi:response regulator [Paenibacillus sp. WLX1005]|uniref:response regulator transcription factor n=1 Tax=Paenibacillus sp. WLX1005 TaxID=3243766 RepID=UPI003983DF70